MVGLGTIVDVVAIIGGGLVGMIFQQFISPQLRRIVMQTLGLAVIFVGMARTLSHMLRIAANGQLTTINSMMLIISLTIGGILGWLVHLENAVTYLAQWFKRIFKRQNDTRFITGFISATIPTCVGAMLIIGALQDGLQHDPQLLFTKAILDGVTVAIFAAAYGMGALLAAVPVGVLQGGITFLAVFVRPWLTTAMLDGVSLVGSVLIFAVGLNVLFELKLPVLNMLPALIVAMVYTLFG